MSKYRLEVTIFGEGGSYLYLRNQVRPNAQKRLDQFGPKFQVEGDGTHQPFVHCKTGEDYRERLPNWYTALY